LENTKFIERLPNMVQMLLKQFSRASAESIKKQVAAQSGGRVKRWPQSGGGSAD
jgi:hypothetical protein